MPRPPRLHVPNGYYHVMLRGNHREPLFGNANDRLILNGIIADVIERFDTHIHAFCWMSNHLHALMQIRDQPLGKIMQRIAMRYSRYRHRKLRTTGHLFERRHRAKLIEVDTYFLTVLRYIHLNPVKAGIVPHPAEYPWSSHRAYLGTSSIPWLTTHFGLALFHSDIEPARREYAKFMAQAYDDTTENTDIGSDSSNPRIFGSDRFIASIPVSLYKPPSTATLMELCESVCRKHHVDINFLLSPSRARNLTNARIDLINNAIKQKVATLTEVARFLGRDPSAITHLLERHETKLHRSARS